MLFKGEVAVGDRMNCLPGGQAEGLDGLTIAPAAPGRTRGAYPAPQPGRALLEKRLARTALRAGMSVNRNEGFSESASNL